MAPDETIENKDDLANEQVTEKAEETVVESTEEQTTDDPLRLSPELQSRYKSAADLEEFAKQKQSEADRLRSELDTYKQQHQPTQPQQPAESEQDMVDRLVRDPVGFVREATNDIRAQLAITEFARAHPDMEQYKAGMKEIVQRSPGVLSDPQGLEMVYLLAKNQADATKLNQAAAIKQIHNAEVKATKQTEAFVEGATASKQKTSPVITDDMSVEEIEKILEAKGIKHITDEEREYYD